MTAVEVLATAPSDLPVVVVSLRLELLPRACPTCRSIHRRAQPCPYRQTQHAHAAAAA